MTERHVLHLTNSTKVRATVTLIPELNSAGWVLVPEDVNPNAVTPAAGSYDEGIDAAAALLRNGGFTLKSATTRGGGEDRRVDESVIDAIYAKVQERVERDARRRPTPADVSASAETARVNEERFGGEPAWYPEDED